MGKSILTNLAGTPTDTPPIWLMRQAGRYLPEYRAIRAKAGSFLNLCYTPELAAEVTLQPIRRFGFDAAILFADILLIAQALGSTLDFIEGEGPKLSSLRSRADIDALRPVGDIHETLGPIYETIRILKGELSDDCALIGFAGAPWTVASYMIAGGSSRDHGLARKWLLSGEEGFRELIELLENATIEYLSAQIEAGAEVVKLFDSWAGALDAPNIERYSIGPMRRIAGALKGRHENVRIIAFPRGAGAGYLAANVPEFDAVAIDSATSMGWARDALGGAGGKCLQGNLDPMLLVVGGEPLTQAARNLCTRMKGSPFIFNLGHGITPDVNPDHVHQLMEAVRGSRRACAQS